MVGKVVNIIKFSVHDGPGIRTTVFLKGCPLSCIWCHNPECQSFENEIGFFAEKCILCGRCAAVCDSRAHRIAGSVHEFYREKCTFCGKCVAACPRDALAIYGKDMTVEEVIDIVLKDRDFYGTEGGMTISGGEPLSQSDFCRALLESAKAAGIHTALDTCGVGRRSALEKLIPYVDLFLYDIKLMDAQKHEQYTGLSNQLVLENLKYITSRGKKAEIRIPLIPGINNDENIAKTGAFLSGLDNITLVRVLPYHSFARSKYRALGKEDTMPKVDRPSDEELRRVVNILNGYGLTAKSAAD